MQTAQVTLFYGSNPCEIYRFMCVDGYLLKTLPYCFKTTDQRKNPNAVCN